MTDAPTIGLALIAKDEEEQLPRLLGSITGAFDRVVLLDTGSEDRTVEIFEEWAADEEASRLEGGPFTYEVGHFDWVDDFAAARIAADELLGDVDWTVWADCDDTVEGADKLRGLAAEAPPDVAAFVFDYDYAHDPNGNVVCLLKRERLVRRGAGRWEGRVHEAQGFDGAAVMVPPEAAKWVHHPPEGLDSSERNLRILGTWIEEEPENPRVLGYIGTEKLIRGEHAEAIPYFERYLALKTGWDEERAQIHRKLAVCQMAGEDYEAAIGTAFAALRVIPSWPDSYLTLAEAHYHLGEFEKAIEWSRDVIERGIPDTLLIINPLDYAFSPKVLLAGSLGALGRLEEAAQIAEEALRVVPQHEGLRAGYASWSEEIIRAQTADTWCRAAKLLVGRDEQLKALRLLEDTPPYFVTDHPDVVALRSALRERIRPLLAPDEYDEHYRSGGSKSEDFIPDDRVDAVAGSLPRSRFLLDGVLDQLGEAA